MDAKASSLLRYRFESFAQLQNHLHVVEGRTLFFYRDLRAALSGGMPVLVELAFTQHEQVTLLRGTVLSRVDGVLSGFWLEFPDARLMRKVDGGAEAMSQRKQKRLGCDLLVEVRQGRATTLGRVTDVSMGGARVTGLPGVRAGHEVEARLIGMGPSYPSAMGRAEVIRAGQGEVGLRFLRSDPIARVAASKLFQVVQQSWTQAHESAHPAICCKGGNVFEPPLPHMKTRA